jgi:hypothetical protein
VLAELPFVLLPLSPFRMDVREEVFDKLDLFGWDELISSIII